MTGQAAPGGETRHSDEPADPLEATIGEPDPEAAALARARLQRLLGAASGSGRLGDLAAWLSGVQAAVPPRRLERVKVVTMAADHGVARRNVSNHPPGATAASLRDALAGRGPLAAVAASVGVTLTVFDLGVDLGVDTGVDTGGDLGPERGWRPDTRFRLRPSGSIDIEDALTTDEAEQAFRAGRAIADQEADAGTDLLVLNLVGRASSSTAAALCSVLLDRPPVEMVGRSDGIDDATWMRKSVAVRDAARRARHLGYQPIRLLATCGGACLAAGTGLLVGAAARRTAVVLDGLGAATCAMIADRVHPGARLWWVAGHLDGEPAHAATLTRLSLEPVLTAVAGVTHGGLLAVPVLRAAQALAAAASL